MKVIELFGKIFLMFENDLYNIDSVERIIFSKVNDLDTVSVIKLKDGKEIRLNENWTESLLEVIRNNKKIL